MWPRRMFDDVVEHRTARSPIWRLLARLLAWASHKLPEHSEPPPLLYEPAPLPVPEPPVVHPAPRIEAIDEGLFQSAPESGERLSARPLTDRNGTPLSVVMAQVIAECRAHVLDRIRKANEMTSTEVIAVANSLDQIVSSAQHQVSATRSALDSLSGSDRAAVTDLLEEQTRISATRFAAIRAALEEQTVLTRQAMQASAQIASVGAGVSRVAFQARLLSLNANIEAARFGEQGGGFQVIATEMRRLTDEIDRANRQIEGMASSLMSALPKINEHADALCRHADGFTAELAQNSSAVSSATTQLKKSVNEVLANGDQTATQVLSGSHAALSHLQFQDPTAQSLLIIDADLARMAEHLEKLLQHAGAESALVPDGVELELQAADAHRALNAGTIAVLDSADAQQAGEVLLF
ncbi:MAG TPA: methyl-accepting chemotaxis protein [Polyangiaceae bacterium]|nr:methyl-accepting chemotaxis protein [Polyangiaceae bacterium]